MIDIRLANAGDADEISLIENECFTDPWSREAILNEIENNRISNVFVAESDNTIIGYMGIWYILDEGHITNIAVAGKYRKKGVGTLLLTEAIEHGKENNITCFTLEVRAGNHEAIKLYEKFGFVKQGIRKEYYEDNKEDAIIMWRKDQ